MGAGGSQAAKADKGAQKGPPRTGQTYSITIKKPLGIKVGGSQWGTTVAQIEANGNAARWNQTCDGNEFDKQRKLRETDVLIGVTSATGVMTDVSGWSLLKVMNFFEQKTGDLVTLSLQRNEEADAQGQHWLENTNGPPVYELSFAPLNVYLTIGTPLGLQLTVHILSADGPIINGIDEGKNASRWNEEQKETNEMQNVFRIADLLLGASHPGTPDGPIVDMCTLDDKQIIAHFMGGVRGGPTRLQIARYLPAEEFRPKALAFIVLLGSDHGLVLKASSYGTVVERIAGGDAKQYNDRVGPRKEDSKHIVEEDYLVGLSTPDSDGLLVNVEGKPHAEVMDVVRALGGAQDFKFKFKRAKRR